VSHSFFQSREWKDLGGAVRGRLIDKAQLAPLTWFRVGGPADVLFLPYDEGDLCSFLQALPADVPVTPLGVGSNLLVRDGGVPGIVIRFASEFNRIEQVSKSEIKAGAGVLDAAIARFAASAGIAGFEFLSGIPGTLGGALRMNAGAYNSEIKDVFIRAVAYDRTGRRHDLDWDDMGFAYRRTAPSEDFLFTRAVLGGTPGSPDEIRARMTAIMQAREKTQPVRSKTGGSTFKNPPPEESELKAWQLIDRAGGRGLTIGDAQVSEKHCNFLINRGNARASDLEALAETVRQKVHQTSGVTLRWEIRRIGVSRPPGNQ